MLAHTSPARLTVCAVFVLFSITLVFQTPIPVDAQYRSSTNRQSTSTQTTRRQTTGSRQQPQLFLSGGARSERVLRDILKVLQKMDQRLQNMERIATDLQKRQ